jgi:glycosyltransferase involved in cell wall biosynthesis
MKIHIISAVFPPEPVVSAKLSFYIANSLSVTNSVRVLSPKPSRPFGFQFSGQSLHFNFKHIQFDSYVCASSSIIGRFKESYSFGKHCYKYIADNHKKIDVIYANTWPLFGQFFVVKAAKKYNIPILIHVQDIYPESLTNKMPFLSPLFNLILMLIDKYVLQNSTKVIAISNQMKNHLVRTRKIESGKITVVQNWQDEEIFVDYKSSNKMNRGNNGPFTFMYLGNIGQVAGIELLIDAFAKAALNNCKLVIAGSGSMKEPLQRKAMDMKLDSIEFLSVPEGKVPEIQDQADVMLLPIKKGAAGSSIPSKLPAYMFSEKPIIACVDDDCDTANAINTANCGWVLPPENVANLAQLMKEIVGLQKEVLSLKGKNGFDYAIQNFSKKNNLQKIINVITETVK